MTSPDSLTEPGIAGGEYPLAISLIKNAAVPLHPNYSRPSGKQITVTVSGDGSADPASGTTDSEGMFYTTITLDSTGAETTVTASYYDSQKEWTFSSTVNIPGRKVSKFIIAPGSVAGANQYVNTGIPFQPVTFQVLDENDEPVQGVEVGYETKRGGMVLEWKPNSQRTDANGMATFDIRSRSVLWNPLYPPVVDSYRNDNVTGGAMLTFSLADEDLRNGLTSIVDDDGETVDKNRVPYIIPDTINIKSRLVAKYGDRVLRLRFVRGPKMRTDDIENKLILNIILDPEAEVTLTNKGFNKSILLSKMSEEIRRHFQNLLSSPFSLIINIEANGDNATNEEFDYDVFIFGKKKVLQIGDKFIVQIGKDWTSFPNFAPDFCGQEANHSRLPMFDGGIRVYLGSVLFYGGSWNSENLGTTLGSLTVHELGHALGLVHSANLLGKNWPLFDAHHNDPYYYELKNEDSNSLYCDMMDQYVNIFRRREGIPEFREINKRYLKIILP